MKAFAFLVGRDDGPGAAVAALARELDFEGVAPFASVAQAEQQTRVTPVCFFLFSATDDATGFRQVAESLRFSTVRRLRFAPLMYFSESPSVEMLNACINLGFDDVITMPFGARKLQERVQRQLGQALTYFETPTYFGPDRRGADRFGTGGGATAPQQVRRLEIVRNLVSGVHVVRDEPVGAGAA